MIKLSKILNYKAFLAILNSSFLLALFSVIFISNFVTVVAQTPVTNTPNDPNKTTVGLPLPNKNSSSSISASSAASVILTSGTSNQTPVVPNNFTPPDTTVRSGGFENTLIYFTIIVTLVSIGYYYKNKSKTALKTEEKRIGK